MLKAFFDDVKFFFEFSGGKIGSAIVVAMVVASIFLTFIDDRPRVEVYDFDDGGSKYAPIGDHPLSGKARLGIFGMAIVLTIGFVWVRERIKSKQNQEKERLLHKYRDKLDLFQTEEDIQQFRRDLEEEKRKR